MAMINVWAKNIFTVDDWLQRESVSTDNTELLLRFNRRPGKASQKNPWLGGGYLEPLEQQGC